MISFITKNNIEAKNKSKIKYKFDDNTTITGENDFKLKALVNGKEFLINNKSKLSFGKDIIKGVNVKLKLGNDYNQFIKDHKSFYSTNILKPGIDVSYTAKFTGVKFKTGLDLEYGLQSRKAIKERLIGLLSFNPNIRKQIENEADKWVYGHQLEIKPYAQLSWDITNELKLETEISSTTKFQQSAIDVFFGTFVPVGKKFNYVDTQVKLKANLKYQF